MKQYTDRLSEHWAKYAGLLYFVVLSVVCLVVFREVLTHGWVLDGNWDRRDHVYPFHVIAKEALASGIWPQWNPFIFCGTSFLFSTINLSFYPPVWAVYALPLSLLPLGLTLFVALHFLLAGWFAYLLFVELCGSKFVSAIFGITFVLSTSMMMNAATESTYYGLALLPVILWLLVSFKRRGWLLNCGLLALTYAFVIVSGVANIFIYVSAVCLAFGVYQMLVDWKGRGGRTLFFVNTVAFLLGLGLASVKLLPFFFDARYYLSQKATYESFLQTGWTPYEVLLRFFMPHFFGDKTYPTTINALLEAWMGSKVLGVMNNYEAFPVYTGVPAAFLCIYAVIFVWSKSSGFWKLALVGTVLTVCGGPLAYVHFVATGSSNIHFGRLAMLVPLYVAALATLGWVLARSSHLELKRFTLFVLGFGCAVWFVAWFVDQRVAGLTGATPTTWPHPTASQMHYLVVSALLVGLLVAAQVAHAKINKRLLDLLLGVLVLADLFVTSQTDKNFSRPFLAPAEDFLVPRMSMLPDEVTQERKFRVLSVDPATHGCKTVHLPALNMSGLDQAAPRFITELYWYPRVPNRMEGRTVMPGNPETADRILQITSTAFVLTPDGLGKVLDPLPRWSLLSQFEVVGDPGAQKQRVLAADFDPHQTVVLEDEPALPISSGAPEGSIVLREESANSIEFEVTAERNSLLLLTNTFYPGWRAEVDGVETPIIKANSAFQSISVPAGSSLVRFHFRHEQWRTGLAVTSVSLLLLLAIFAGSAGPLFRRARGV